MGVVACSILVVTALLAAISVIDLRTRRIPNALSLALTGWAAVQALWLGRPTPGAAALGLAVGGGLFLVLALIGRGAVGMGDVKLAAALGALLGYPLILRGLFWGIVAGGVVAAYLLLTRRAGRRDYFAYGPCLALGGWVAYLASLGPWR